jgi:hypothetical protein
MRRFFFVVLFPLVVLLPAGCPVSYIGPAGGSGDVGTGGTVQQVSSLFVQQANGSYDFTTNDSAYIGPNGFTLWSLAPADQATFVRRTVSLSKASGELYAGYGIVFCQYDTGSPALVESMLLVMINAAQQYTVGEATGSTYTPYTSPLWVPSTSLVRGYGVSNTVEVTRDETGLFSLFLNSGLEMTFRDGRTPLRVGGRDGYLAVISPYDNFPNIPVSVLFKDE